MLLIILLSVLPHGHPRYRRATSHRNTPCPRSQVLPVSGLHRHPRCMAISSCHSRIPQVLLIRHILHVHHCSLMCGSLRGIRRLRCGWLLTRVLLRHRRMRHCWRMRLALRHRESTSLHVLEILLLSGMRDWMFLRRASLGRRLVWLSRMRTLRVRCCGIVCSQRLRMRHGATASGGGICILN